MPAAFLSPEWLDELGRRLASAVAPGAVPLRLGVLVTDVPLDDGSTGEVAYTLVLGGPDGSGVVPGTIEGADVDMVETFVDARSLATGRVSAAALLEAGRIKLRGDAGRLVAATETLRAVGQAFGTVPPD